MGKEIKLDARNFLPYMPLKPLENLFGKVNQQWQTKDWLGGGDTMLWREYLELIRSELSKRRRKAYDKNNSKR
jgi:hypothetical protein